MNRAPVLAIVLMCAAIALLPIVVRERLRYEPTGWEGYERRKVTGLEEQLRWR